VGLWHSLSLYSAFASARQVDAYQISSDGTSRYNYYRLGTQMLNRGQNNVFWLFMLSGVRLITDRRSGRLHTAERKVLTVFVSMAGRFSAEHNS